MKTTVELPQPLLLRAKRLAAQRGVSLKSLIIEGLEAVTRVSPQEDFDFGGDASPLEIDRYGVPVLRRNPGSSMVVLAEDIEKIREELGI